MKPGQILVVFVILLLGTTVAVADEPACTGCADYDLSELTQARPVVRVEPAFGEELRAAPANGFHPLIAKK